MTSKYLMMIIDWRVNARIKVKGEVGNRVGIWHFPKKIAVKFLTPGKNVRSNIIKIPHPRKWFVVKCLQNIQISLPPRQQDNSNALPLGQSDRSNPCSKCLFCSIPLVFIHLLYVSSTQKWQWNRQARSSAVILWESQEMAQRVDAHLSDVKGHANMSC